QAREVGKGLDKTLEIRDDGRDLRLLQHHLGEPYAIRIARALPWQVMPAVTAVPEENARGEGLRAHARRVSAKRGAAAPWPRHRIADSARSGLRACGATRSCRRARTGRSRC